MRGAVLRIDQSGDHIRMFPIGRGNELLAEEIVADGRPYEKALGSGRGVVTASWSKDGESLWLELAAGPRENPRATVQRSVWKLSRDRKTWIRHSVTVQGGERAETRLVFRKREKAPNPTPSPRASGRKGRAN